MILLLLYGGSRWALFSLQVSALPARLMAWPSIFVQGSAFLPVLNFFRFLSPLAWIPFAILWFHIGDKPAIFLIFMATFFPLALATMSAVATIPSIYFRVAQDYDYKGTELLTKVTFPAVLPQVITALAGQLWYCLGGYCCGRNGGLPGWTWVMAFGRHEMDYDWMLLFVI